MKVNDAHAPALFVDLRTGILRLRLWVALWIRTRKFILNFIVTSTSTVTATLTFTFLSYPIVRVSYSIVRLSYPIVRVSYQVFRLSYRKNRLSGFPFIVYQVYRVNRNTSAFSWTNKRKTQKSPTCCYHCRVIKYCGFLFAVTIYSCFLKLKVY